MEKQETQRPNVLADVEEIYEYPKDTSNGVSKDISEKCLLGKCLIEEPYALIGHVRFCEGLLRLEPLIAKQYMVKGCEKVETKSTRRAYEQNSVRPRYKREFCTSVFQICTSVIFYRSIFVFLYGNVGFFHWQRIC